MTRGVKVAAVGIYVVALLAAAYIRGEVGDPEVPLSPPQFWLHAVLAFGCSLVAGAVLGAPALAGPAVALLVIFGLLGLGAPFETFASDPLWGLAVLILAFQETLVVAVGIGVGRLAHRLREVR